MIYLVHISTTYKLLLLLISYPGASTSLNEKCTLKCMIRKTITTDKHLDVCVWNMWILIDDRNYRFLS